MVKIILARGPGGPEVLEPAEVELLPPGAGEVQVRHRAVGVNFIDVYRRRGLYPAQFPLVPGHEGAGEVVAVGASVTDFKAGDRVAYVGPIGAYCAARNVAASALVKLPDAFSFEAGATMMLKGLTAQYLLRRTFRVGEGHRVLVHAGAGGTGQLLCSWARALGAFVIATVGSPAKAEIARAAGAQATILYRDEDFPARVREITKGELCHVVYDGVGAATFPASLDCLAPFGFFVSFGQASGPIPPFDLGLLAQKGSLYAARPSLFTHIADRRVYEEMFADLIAAAEQGFVRFESPQRFPLDQAAAVHAALESRKTSGAMVLEP